MDGFDPGALGWSEFWLRIAALAVLIVVILLMLAIAVRITIDIRDGVGWVVRKIRGRTAP